MKDYREQDPRKEKRFLRKMGYTAMYEAWSQGEYAGMYCPERRNPYPPGRRHDEFERGRKAVHEESYWGKSGV